MKRLVGDIFFSETGNLLHFGNTAIDLAFGKYDGNLVEIRDNRSQCLLTPTAAHAPMLILRTGGHPVVDGTVRNDRRPKIADAQEIGYHSMFSHHSISVDRNQAILDLTFIEDFWAITARFTLTCGSDLVRRDVRIEYTGSGVGLLRDVRFNLPVVRIMDLDDNLVHAPDYPVVTNTPVSDLPDGLWAELDSVMITDSVKIQHSVDSPGSVVGLVGISNPAANMSLLVWSYTDAEPTLLEAWRKPDGIAFSQLHLVAGRLAEGSSIVAGSHYFQLFAGNWQEAMSAYPSWYAAAGLTVPRDKPAWSSGLAIYEAHLGSAPFPGKSYAPYPDADDLRRDLPRIKAMGFEAIQLMPHWPFCGYTVHRYESIEKQYDAPDRLKAMIDQAHEHGLRVILDIVMHGAIDKEIVRLNKEQFGPGYDYIFDRWLDEADEISWYRTEHPEWFMLDETGQMARLYTWAFDHAHLGFQRYFINVLKYYLAELAIDGFRFDAPNWNTIPNWREDLADRPSSSYYASYPLLIKAREEIRQEFPDALFFTEPSGPIFRCCMDCNYNYDEEWLTGALFSHAARSDFAGSVVFAGRRPTAADAASWFYCKELSLPPGSMTVHHLDSHDTFWWSAMAQFRREAIGLDAARAMFAIFAMIGGGILSYVGAEQGNDVFYAQLLNLRRNTRELKHGLCDFISARVEDKQVFAVIRALDAGRLLVLINTRPDRSETRVTIKQTALAVAVEGIHSLLIDSGGGAASCYAENTSGDSTLLHVVLPPYGVAIWRLN